jgi:hypothetical protein
LIKKTLGTIDPHYESLLVKQIQDFNKNFKGKPKDSGPPKRTTSTSSGSYAGAYTPYQGEFLEPHHSQFIIPQSFQGRGRGRERFTPQQYPNISTIQQMNANNAYHQGLLEGVGLTQNQPKRKFSPAKTEQKFRKKGYKKFNPTANKAEGLSEGEGNETISDETFQPFNDKSITGDNTLFTIHSYHSC